MLALVASNFGVNVTGYTGSSMEFLACFLTFEFCTGCPRKFVPRLPEDYDKAAKGHHHTFT